MSKTSSIIRLDRNEAPIPWDGFERCPMPSDTGRAYPDESALKNAWAQELGVDASSVLPTNGGDEAIEIAMSALLAPDATIVAPTPIFSTFEVVARRLGQRIEGVPYGPEGEFPKQDLLVRCASARPDAVVLVDPSNPTGTLVPEPEALVPRVREAIGPKAVIIYDGAYADFAGRNLDAALIGADPRLVTVRSLSKSPGLAGLRCGALVGRPDVIEMCASRRLIFSVNAATCHWGPLALRDRAARDACVRAVTSGREALRRWTAEAGVVAIFGAANYALLLMGERGPEFVRACANRGVPVRDLTACPVYPGGVRVTILDETTMAEACERLSGALTDIGLTREAAR